MDGAKLKTNHPSPRLNEVVHEKTRLGILAILNEADSVAFPFLQKTLVATAGNLSRHLNTLEEAGLVELTKGYQGKRPRTLVSLTRQGKAAFPDEIRALRAITRFLPEVDESA